MSSKNNYGERGSRPIYEGYETILGTAEEIMIGSLRSPNGGDELLKILNDLGGFVESAKGEGD